MGRPMNVIPTVKRSVMFDSENLTKMELELFSELEGRVPHGSLSSLMNQLLKEWLEKRAGRV